MYQSIQDQTKQLPIAKHKGDILRKIDRHRVIIVSGDTGCGKTT
jgi:HrpA-like RNA helicase